MTVLSTPHVKNRHIQFSWGNIFFFLVHASCLLLFLTPISWTGVILFLALYLVRTFSITGGYHRYFAHHSYRLNRFNQFVLAFIGGTCGQKGALWWTAHHRHHHQHSDTDEDIHSAKKDGFYWSHLGWMISKEYHTAYDPKKVRDLIIFPELVWLDKYHLVPPTLLAIACYLIGGMTGLIWGFVLSTVVLYHLTFSVNSMCHMFGSHPHETGESSKNNVWLSLPTLGESWHNNHHKFPAIAQSGIHWWQVDPTFYAIKVLSWLGIARNVKTFRRASLVKADSPATDAFSKSSS